ncbi:hypothetical protein GCM10027180_03900 [Microbulbifer echini]
MGPDRRRSDGSILGLLFYSSSSGTYSNSTSRGSSASSGGLPAINRELVSQTFIWSVGKTPYQYASGELLGIVLFRTIAWDISTSPRAQPLPIRHFDAVTEHDFKATMARKRYHRICDRRAPQRLTPCAVAQWQYRQAKDCLEAREKWEVKWGNAETAAPHKRAFENVRARLKNAERNQRRHCDLQNEREE